MPPEDKRMNPGLMTLVFGPEEGFVPARTFADALESLVKIFRELDINISRERKSNTSWVISALSMESPATVEILGVPAPGKVDVGGQVLEAFQDGISHLESHKSTPEYFTESALRAARRLAIAPGKEGKLQTTVMARAIDITEHVSANVKSILQGAHMNYGSVEGKLEAVNLHGRREFRVYDFRGRGIPCRFTTEQLTEVRDNLGKRVTVWGIKKTDKFGNPLSIVKIEHMKPLRSDEELPGSRDLPKLALGQKSEDYIKKRWND